MPEAQEPVYRTGQATIFRATSSRRAGFLPDPRAPAVPAPQPPSLSLPVNVHSLRRRFLLAAASAAALLAPTVAQSADPSLQKPFAIGLNRSQRKPYSFTGRVFDNNNIGFGSGTLIRRHTLLTAAHVVFDPATGFGTSFTFERALYFDPATRKTTRLSTSRSLAVSALSGYQDVAADPLSTESESRDLGYVVLVQPSIDEDFAPYKRQPEPVFKDNNLTDNSGRFVIGYPGVTFNGRTMAYIVPQAPFVEVGAGYYRNFDYLAEPGMSGGPVYSVINGVQTVVGETTDGLADTSGEFSFSDIRAIDKEADAFLASAEYSAGLIVGTTITPADPNIVVDPKLNQISVNRGDSILVNTRVLFKVPGANGNPVTTDRYTELKLTSDLSDTPPPFSPTGTVSQPLITIVKVVNNQFRVTFSAQNKANTIVTLQVKNSKTTNAPSAPIPANATVSPAPSQLRVLLK